MSSDLIIGQAFMKSNCGFFKVFIKTKQTLHTMLCWYQEKLTLGKKYDLV